MTYYKTNPDRISLLGHLSFGIRSMDRAESFYNAVFPPFGIKQIYRNQPAATSATVCGWGYDDKEIFTLFERSDIASQDSGTHLAFNAPSRGAVDEFYAAALRSGGRGDGEPGLRRNYGENYYACFVYDPDGHKLEAVYQQSVVE